MPEIVGKVLSKPEWKEGLKGKYLRIEVGNKRFNLFTRHASMQIDAIRCYDEGRSVRVVYEDEGQWTNIKELWATTDEETTPPVPEEVKPKVAKAADSMSKGEWAEKDAKERRSYQLANAINLAGIVVPITGKAPTSHEIMLTAASFADFVSTGVVPPLTEAPKDTKQGSKASDRPETPSAASLPPEKR